MGCDIHVHTEIKINGVWHHANQLRFERNYNLFARMAGVRNYNDKIKPIAQLRGLPDDATVFTRFDADRWGIDGHSHSWLGAAEVAGLGVWMEAEHAKHSQEYWYCEIVIGYVFGSGWDAFTEHREYLPKGVEDARLVFWFDN
jgi:diadenosine tetraphosphatase ApaH/serine/threonine PP2A family protein phosphatase